MTFQIKDFASITASEVNHARAVTRKITDFQPGSVTRTLMEAPAVEIEELYLQMFLGLRDAIPVATFLSFGFDKLPAAVAAGYVSVSAQAPLAQDLLIPAGTEFLASDGRQYLSRVDVTWAAGTSIVRIPVVHTAAGLDGNIAAGAITSSPFFGAEYTVGNQAIENGRDVEKDDEREARFAEFVQAISRGTIVACRYEASQSVVLDANGDRAEYVTRIGVDEQPGHVRIYLYSNIGSPSLALLANGQERIDGRRDPVTGVASPGYRAAGIRMDVLGMAERAIDLGIRVEMQSGYVLDASVEQDLGDIFAARISAVLPGETLYLGSLIEALLAVPGVQSIVPDSTENIVCEINEALVPGTLSVRSL